MNSKIPIARTEKLVVQDSVNEVLVYDLETNTAHCLNETAAFVWANCDGKKSVTEIEILVTKKFGSGAVSEFVRLALDGLEKNGLLLSNSPEKFNLQNATRREMIRRAGLTAMIALPVISKLIAPQAAHAASLSPCAQLGGICVQSGQNLCPASGIFTFVQYTSANGSCTGSSSAPVTFACVSGNSINGADVCRLP